MMEILMIIVVVGSVVLVGIGTYWYWRINEIVNGKRKRKNDELLADYADLQRRKREGRIDDFRRMRDMQAEINRLQSQLHDEQVKRNNLRMQIENERTEISNLRERLNDK